MFCRVREAAHDGGVDQPSSVKRVLILKRQRALFRFCFVNLVAACC
uniref:Uncharacterized protein MANES_09G164200 n=1 Tax=Rhizophora mucronata TaxID=61149 RepID=A0A2P2PEN1_RHIMU